MCVCLGSLVLKYKWYGTTRVRLYKSIILLCFLTIVAMIFLPCDDYFLRDHQFNPPLFPSFPLFPLPLYVCVCVWERGSGGGECV